MSGAPPERNEYLTLISPFDSYTWVFTLVSLVGVSISLVLIDKLHATWSNESLYDLTFQCEYELGSDTWKR